MTAMPAFMFTDPGVDDTLAFSMIAAAPRIDLVGACASAGNVPAPLGARNLSYVSSLLGGAVPLFRGRNVGPSRPMFDGRIAHGRWGLGWFRAPNAPAPVRSYRAIAEHLCDYDGITILSTSPMTDLAATLRHRRVLRRIRRIVAMGGSASVGNVTACAEFNIRFNPEAAAEVFRSGVPLDMVTLDLTQRIRFDSADLGFTRGERSELRRVFREALDFYFRFHLRYEGFRGCYVHDPTAAAAVIWPRLFQSRSVPASVETVSPVTYGMTVFDRRYRSRQNRSRVALTDSPDTGAVKERILASLNEL